uniref:G_PROTEIN_RECEP_F1_2 domain-containing protein n=1 Tax=Syphacia muris TaxID=451379 RepID=A0A0N5AID0_9BILA
MNPEKLGTIVNIVKLSLLVMCAFSALLQIYVIATAIKFIRKKIGDRNLHLFLLNMTVADLLLTGKKFIKPIYVPSIDYSTHVIAWIALSVSALSLVLLNIDKLIYFLFRLEHLNILTHFRAVLLILITWLLSIVFVGVTFLSGTFECLNRRQSFIYTERAINLTDFQLISDYTKVARKNDIISVTAESSNSFEITYKDSDVAEEGMVANPSLSRRNQTFFYRLRTFYFVFVSTIFTFLTLIPYRIFSLYKFAQNDNWKLDCWQYFLALLIMHVQYLNAVSLF